jgi:hypothetical protein
MPMAVSRHTPVRHPWVDCFGPHSESKQRQLQHHLAVAVETEINRLERQSVTLHRLRQTLPDVA